MDNPLLFRFKDYVNNNYKNSALTVSMICYGIGCSKTCLHELLKYRCGCSIMEYVENYRIMKSIELILSGTRKVHLHIGYKTSAAFSKAFLTITGFHSSCFYAVELNEYEVIISEAYNIAIESPKKAVQFVINDSTMIDILSENRKMLFNKTKNSLNKKIKPKIEKANIRN